MPFGRLPTGWAGRTYSSIGSSAGERKIELVTVSVSEAPVPRVCTDPGEARPYPALAEAEELGRLPRPPRPERRSVVARLI